MPPAPAVVGSKKARKIPLRRTVPGLVRNPLKALEAIGSDANGAIVQLDLGFFRPYLVTRPEHVQHILRDHSSNYVREGMIWRPIRRLLGDGLVFDGPTWESRRKLVRPLLSVKAVDKLIDRMAEAIGEAISELDPHIRSGRTIDAYSEMTRIVHRAVISVFFADSISRHDAADLAEATATAFTSLGSRTLLPFVPDCVPMPGDRAFKRAVRTVNRIVYPIIDESRQRATNGMDVVSLLIRARDENGHGLDDEQIRDDFVAMFIGGTETTSVALTWLWVVLDANPGLASGLYSEIDRVVGRNPPGRTHLPNLRYTRMVLQELLRLYPPVWILPRTAMQNDVVDGVLIEAGATVIVSPFVTQRMELFWDRPHTFDPSRFGSDNGERSDNGEHWHRFAYLAFGGGPHQCLGSHFFMVESQLIVASLLGRYRPLLKGTSPNEPQAKVSLRPRHRVEVLFRPVENSQR